MVGAAKATARQASRRPPLPRLRGWASDGGKTRLEGKAKRDAPNVVSGQAVT